MILGARKHCGASLRLCRPSALPLRMRGGIVELRALETEPDQRGQGLANALLCATCLEADNARQVIMLHVQPGEDTDNDRLVALYERHGFATIQEWPHLMARSPQGTAHGR